MEMKWSKTSGMKLGMKGKKEFSYKMESYCLQKCVRKRWRDQKLSLLKTVKN